MELNSEQPVAFKLTNEEVVELFDAHEEFPELAEEATRQFAQSLLTDKELVLGRIATPVDALDKEMEPFIQKLASDYSPTIEDAVEFYAYWELQSPGIEFEFTAEFAPQLGEFCVHLVSQQRNVVEHQDEELIRVSGQLSELIAEKQQRDSKGLLKRFAGLISIRHEISPEQIALSKQLQDTIDAFNLAKNKYYHYYDNFQDILAMLPEDARADLQDSVSINPLESRSKLK